MPGSGGHTTCFRMVEALEEAGHQCVVHVYDRYQSHVNVHAQVIRKHWPALKARIVDARAGLEPADAYVATSWDSAHVIGRRGSVPGRRLYFVQDYEPYFYPHGSEYTLADDTYRFGFRTIALGGMVAERLRATHRIPDRILFGTDLSIYRMTNEGPRHGVVFYASRALRAADMPWRWRRCANSIRNIQSRRYTCSATRISVHRSARKFTAQYRQPSLPSCTT